MARGEGDGQGGAAAVPGAFAMRLVLFALLAALVGGPATGCGGAEEPCRVSGAWGEGSYRLVPPEGPGSGAALVFLHGWGGRADAVAADAGLLAPWRAAGWAVIAPQGEPRAPGDSGGRWNSAGGAGGRDDVAFLRAVAEDAAARAGLDRGRIVLGGFSGGGMMAWRVACEAPGDFAAFLPVAGLLWRPLPEGCAGPVRLLHVHGWADAVVPLEGRAVAGGRLVQGDLFAGLALLRRANGCAGDAPDAVGAEGVFLVRGWTGCAPGAALGFALFPGGHVAPEGWGALALGWLAGLP